MARRSLSTKGRSNNQFTSLLECGECGAVMWKQGNGPRMGKVRLEVWCCSVGKRSHATITHLDLLEKVGRALETGMRTHLKARQVAEPPPQTPQPDAGVIADLQAQRGRVEDLFQLGKISIESYDRRVSEIDEKIKTATEKSAAAEIRAVRRDQVMKLLMSNLADQSQHLPHWLNHAPPGEVNVVLHALFEKIVLKGKEIELVFWE